MGLVSAETAPATMPAFLADAIARRHAATLALTERPWAAGQIHRLHTILDRDGNPRRALARPVALLLDRQDSDPHRWSGWLVAPETDYASAWDILLESDVDDPFDPLAGMVQVWNPLVCRLAADAPLLAALSEERLAAVLIADAFPRLDRSHRAPRLRRAAQSTVIWSPPASRRSAVAATRAAPTRASTSELGREMCLPTARSDGAEPFGDNVVPLRRNATAAHRKPLWMALAASVLVVQSGVIGYLSLNEASRPVDESSIYRSAGDAQASRAQIEVSFRTDAKEQDIRRLLVALGAEIVGGPGQLGFYQLRLPDGGWPRPSNASKARPSSSPSRRFVDDRPASAASRRRHRCRFHNRHPGQRIALVIGNAQYARKPLANPVNDARLIEATLTKLGFKVDRLENATLADMEHAATAFLPRRRPPTSSLFYYAGHGAQVGGKNYLIPVDNGKLVFEDDLRTQGLDATGNIVDYLDRHRVPRGKLSIVVLDACRNSDLKASGRGLADGLAEPAQKPEGIAFAFYRPSPGQIARDSPDRRNSRYTESFAEAIRIPGFEVKSVFARVRDTLATETRDSKEPQTPWFHSSTSSDELLLYPCACGRCGGITPPPLKLVKLAKEGGARGQEVEALSHALNDPLSVALYKRIDEEAMQLEPGDLKPWFDGANRGDLYATTVLGFYYLWKDKTPARRPVHTPNRKPSAGYAAPPTRAMPPPNTNSGWPMVPATPMGSTTMKSPAFTWG